MNPDKYEELASLYAFGLLEGEELAAFERELQADPELSTVVSELQHDSVQSTLSEALRAAPPAVKERVRQLIGAQPSPPQPPPVSRSIFGWVSWALAGAIAVFAGLTWNTNSKLSQSNAELASASAPLTQRGDSLAQENATLTTRQAALETERARLEKRISAQEAENHELSLRIGSLESRNPLEAVKAVALSAQADAPKDASVTALWDGPSQTGVLGLAKLPAPPPGKDYQLWIFSPDLPLPMSVGLISAGTPGLAFKSPRPLAPAAALAISIEPKGGSESPSGSVIFVGNL